MDSKELVFIYDEQDLIKDLHGVGLDINNITPLEFMAFIGNKLIPDSNHEVYITSMYAPSGISLSRKYTITYELRTLCKDLTNAS